MTRRLWTLIRYLPTPAQPADIWLRLYVGVTVIASLGALVMLSRGGLDVESAEDAGVVIALGLLWMVLERARTELFGQSRISLGVASLLSLAFLAGAQIAGGVGLAVYLTVHWREQSPWYKKLFNAATISIAGMTGAYAFELITPTSNDPLAISLSALPAVLVGSETVLLVNSFLIAGALAISTRGNILSIWKEKFQWLVPHYAALGLASYAMVAAYLDLGTLGLVVFLLPIGMLWISVRQYTARTKKNLSLLHEANDALASSEERFRALVQNAPGFIAVVDNSMNISYLNSDPEPSSKTRNYNTSLEQMVHPEDIESLQTAIAAVCVMPGAVWAADLRLTLQLGKEWRQYSVTFKNLLGHRGVNGIVLNGRDVTEERKLGGQLRHQSLHDPLTALPNRALFYDRLGHAIESARRRGNQVALLVIDIDRFKVLNDSLGHDRGDALLISVANRLRDIIRPGDTIARLGGDEFVVLCEDISFSSETHSVAMKLLQAFDTDIVFADNRAVISVSIGGAMTRAPDVHPRELLRSADVALMRAKSEGRGRYVLFDEKRDSASADELNLEVDIKWAVVRDEIEVHYQPILELMTGRIIGFEALARWAHPTRGLIAPDKFIRIAEETGDIVGIGRAVMREAICQAKTWQQRFFDRHKIFICVNVSARELSEPDIVEDICDEIGRIGIDPSTIVIELTESALVRDVKRAQDACNRLRSYGVQIAIDDFGTGYSSLSYLKTIPATLLKVDRSFVNNIGSDLTDDSIARAIVALAKALGMRVTAEGIETVQQLDALIAMGCATGQGFYFSRPLPSEVMENYIIDNSRLQRAA